MKKLIIATLATTLALGACQKQEAPAPKDAPNTNSQTPPPPPAHQGSDAGHGHAGYHHDHAGHHHPDGESYACADKNAIIALHDHEGEKEAHLTMDDITYDLADDSKGGFVSTESVLGDDKGMVLTLNGDKARFANKDGVVIFDCQKSPKQS